LASKVLRFLAFGALFLAALEVECRGERDHCSEERRAARRKNSPTSVPPCWKSRAAQAGARGWIGSVVRQLLLSHTARSAVAVACLGSSDCIVKHRANEVLPAAVGLAPSPCRAWPADLSVVDEDQNAGGAPVTRQVRTPGHAGPHVTGAPRTITASCGPSSCRMKRVWAM
jgi:hypothetical protein